jgi:hypothetical protein
LGRGGAYLFKTHSPGAALGSLPLGGGGGRGGVVRDEKAKAIKNRPSEAPR